MDANNILRYLQNKQNVLLMGAPGTGKSRLMNEVAYLFENSTSAFPTTPTLNMNSSVPIPQNTIQTGHLTQDSMNLPMMKNKNRKVFRTTLHQNSKYRDFLTGIVPTLNGGNGYTVCEGILYRANEYAKQPDSAALLIIDELNRGPAIEVFGNSIVALETDKRLDSNNQISPTTQLFELPVTKSGPLNYALSPHLFILAAMNQADVSVAPLDVAFLRRWQSILLQPDYKPLYKKFMVDRRRPIPDANPTEHDIFNVAFQALEKINSKITVGKGEEYQLGQGVFLSNSYKGTSIDEALDFVVDCWKMIFAHIAELFYGDPNAISYLINAGKDKSPYSLNEITFAGETRYVLSHKTIDRETIYDLYKSIIED